MNNEITISVSKARRRKKITKIVRWALLIFILLLFILYVIVSIVYNSGSFSITLDRNLYYKRGLIIYDDPNYKVFRAELYAPVVDSFDNISQKWLPEDLNNHDGSHNGDNYVAYSFYIENLGEDVTDYWSEIVIDDVTKNVDEAVRIRVYKNGVYTTYAKASKNGENEKNTVAFKSNTLVALDHAEKFKPGDKNKYTIVIWLEGTDPDCTDNILGGEIKLHMGFNSEIVEK